MKLTVSDNKNLTHKELCTCVGWVTSEEVFTCGDDHKLMKWMVENEEGSTVTDFGDGVYPTEMQWLPRVAGDASRRGNEVLALGTAEGKVWLLNRAGRVEKAIEAHVGAVLCVRWSWDCGALLTGGEDGIVKIWSRSGMLRSSLAQNAVPVYSASWAPNNDQIVFSCGKQLIVKSMQANVKPKVWKAHDSVVLKVDWSPTHGMIVSGGEDCKYKVWTSYGTLVFASASHDYPITSVAWAPDGSTFAAAGFDMLRLCDKNGWSHSLERIARVGSLLGLAWSADSTQLAGATGSGRVIVAHVTGLQLQWRYLTATLDQERRRMIHIDNPIDGAREALEFRDRVVKTSFCHQHLVVATISNCYIYSVKNWNTPVVLDLKESRITLIIQSTRNLLLVDGSIIQIYSYEGRLQASPRCPQGVRLEAVDNQCVSISSDILAITSGLGSNIVYILDLSTTSSGSGPSNYRQIQHCRSIQWIGLEQTILSNTLQRHIAILDQTGELWIYDATVASSSTNIGTRLASQVTSCIWHEIGASLAATSTASVSTESDVLLSSLIIWPRPSLAPTASLYVSTGNSTNLQLQSFWSGSRALLRRQNDGSLISISVPPFIETLDSILSSSASASSSKWTQALALCRSVNNNCLWKLLAALAINNKDLDTAQMAYAALTEVDRVEYLERAKSMSSKEGRQAELLLAAGRIQDAETMLTNAGLLGRAVMIQLRLYCWDKALNLSVDNDDLLVIVLGYRRRFLERLGRQETNKPFLKFSDREVPEWQVILEKVAKLETMVKS